MVESESQVLLNCPLYEDLQLAGDKNSTRSLVITSEI